MTLTRSDDRPWYKEPWPWILMAGPGLVIVAAVVTIWLAVVSNDGLVSGDYYKQGLAVNQRLQRDHQAGALGMHADVMRSDSNLRLMITSVQPTALPEKIVLKLSHPTQAGQDQLIEMAAESTGFYSGRLQAEIAGKWHVALEDPAGQWRLQGVWHAESEEPLRLTAKAE